MRNKSPRCLACATTITDKDTVAINKKLLGTHITAYYCLPCLAEYLGCDVQDILDKIEDFKSEGCTLFA